MSEQIRDKARAVGLDRLTDEYLAQFDRATSAMEQHLRRLPNVMPVEWEPAHIYRAKGKTL